MKSVKQKGRATFKPQPKGIKSSIVGQTLVLMTTQMCSGDTLKPLSAERLATNYGMALVMVKSLEDSRRFLSDEP